jgi:hypothetical protein
MMGPSPLSSWLHVAEEGAANEGCLHRGQAIRSEP